MKGIIGDIWLFLELFIISSTLINDYCDGKFQGKKFIYWYNLINTIKSDLSEKSNNVLEISNSTDSSINIPINSTANQNSSYWQICTDISTCKHNCGHVLGPGRRHQDKIFRPCNCDLFCEKFHDCCADYREECKGMVSSDMNIINADKLPYILMTSTVSKWEKAIKLIMALNPKKDYSFGCIYTPDRIGIDEYTLMVNKCPFRWNHEKIRQLCENATYDNIFTMVPVYSSENVTFRNQYCAKCNRANNTIFWAVRAQCPGNLRKAISDIFDNEDNPNLLLIKAKCEIFYEKPRMRHIKTRDCLTMISDCPENAYPKYNKNIHSLCKNYNAPVVAILKSSPNEYNSFKNVFCALCHGFNVDQLTCPNWFRNETTNVWDAIVRGYAVNDISFPSRNKFKTNRFLAPEMILDMKMPAPLSIIMNFGQDGTNHLIFPVEDECPMNMVYDPFINQCRKVFCSPGYELLNSKCVKNGTDDDFDYFDKDDINDIKKGGTGFINNTVYISLVVKLKEEIEKYEQALESMKLDVMTTLTKLFHIDPSRINNISFGLVDKQSLLSQDPSETHPPNISINATSDDEDETFFRVSFTLKEVLGNLDEPSIAKVMSQMSSFVSLSSGTYAFEFIEYPEALINKQGEIIVDSFDIDGWCKKVNRKKYVSNEFSTILGSTDEGKKTDWSTQIYINSTQSLYKKGEFIANLLFVKTKDSLNIHGNVVVCQRPPKLMKTCPRISLNSTEYSIFPNRSILHKYSKRLYNLSQYEHTTNGDIMVCMVQYPTMFYFDVTQSLVSTILFIISLITMILTMITYAIFSELRNLPGMNVMNLTASLILAQLLFLLGTSGIIVDILCILVAMALHYSYLVTFFWMNIMSYDLFCTFAQKGAVSSIRSKHEHLLWYVLYAYGIPAIIIGTCVFIDLCKCIKNLSIGYGHGGICWIQNPLACLLSFGIPIAIILIVNAVFFMRTIFSIRSIKKMVKQTAESENSKNDNLGLNELKLYVRISSVMGFTWIFGFANSYINYTETPNLAQIITYLFIICNTLQGVFIFCTFILNKRVFKLYKKLCCSLKPNICCHCEKYICRCSTFLRSNLSQLTLSSELSLNSDDGKNTPKPPKSIKINFFTETKPTHNGKDK